MKVALSILLSVLLMQPVWAQDAPPPDELLALNFYIQQKDQAAVDAELRRLQLKYPQWAPPSDLAQLAVTAPTTEIDDIYRMIAAGQLAEARALIDATKQKFPSWPPPAEMTALLETAEGQLALDAALAGGDVGQSVKIASSTPGLLRCDRVNNAWRIAEAQSGAGQKADALATYRAVLSACTNFADITASLEKADAVSSDEELSAIFTQIKGRFPDQITALDDLQKRLMSGRGATPKAPQPAQPARPVVVEQAQTPELPAPTPLPQATVETGAAEPPPRAPVADSGSGCSNLGSSSTSAQSLYQRGWCVYNLDRPMEAIADFNAALSGRLPRTQQRDARYGIALAYLKMQMPEEASRIAAATDFTRDQRVDVEGQILDQRGVVAYRKKQYRRAIAYFDAFEQLRGGLRRDLAILRAYAYLNSGNRAEAQRQFTVLHDQMATAETRRGLQASSGD